MRYVVKLTREGDIAVVNGKVVEYADESVVVGPFRSIVRAEKRAGVIRKLAEQYEDPEGMTGPGNALYVTVEPILRGPTSAPNVLDVLYHCIPAESVR